MKKLLLLFFVLLVIPLANALTVTHTGSFTAGDSLNITIDMEDASYAGNLFWNTTSSNNLTWSLVNGSGTFSSTGDNYTFHANDSGVVNLGLTSNVSESFNLTVHNTTVTNVTNITVNPASAVTFYMCHDGSATVCVAENITLSAKDTYNNTDTNYNYYGFFAGFSLGRDKLHKQTNTAIFLGINIVHPYYSSFYCSLGLSINNVQLGDATAEEDNYQIINIADNKFYIYIYPLFQVQFKL